MAPQLPDDILYLISAQLFDQREFNTLFNCSVASRSLTVPACQNLYRMQDAAPVKSGGVDDAQSLAKDSIARWAKLWRSILLSTLGKTVFPYCRYIRVLDLNDLGSLFQDNKFRSDYSKSFFSGDLLSLFSDPNKPQTRNRPPKSFDDVKILELIAGAIIAKAPMLEELITGYIGAEISQEALASFIPQLPRLTHLRLFDGLKAQGVGPLLRDNCPSFRALKFYNAKDGADMVIGDLLSELKPNTLESLEIFSSAQISVSLFSSFNHHSESLTDLNLGEICKSSLRYLADMKSCTNLRSLQFKLGRGADDGSFQEQIPTVVEWLQDCHNLSTLHFEDFSYDTTILEPLLLNPQTRLSTLSVVNYDASSSLNFHSALTHQSGSLRSLYLKADGESADSDALVASLIQIPYITDLRLQGVSDFFQNHHLFALAQNLIYLEDLYISGWSISDEIWSHFAKLQFLRRLDINAFSHFTTRGILSFIEQLGEGNRGMALAVMMAHPGTAIPESGQARIRARIAEKVDGRFDYQLGRDPDADSDSSDSD